MAKRYTLTAEEVGKLKDAMDAAILVMNDHQGIRLTPRWFQVVQARADLAYLTDGGAGFDAVAAAHVVTLKQPA